MRPTIKVIGKVENSFTRRERLEADHTVSRIVIDPSYSGAMDGIEGFSHIDIVFWLDRVTAKERRTLKVHPRGDASNPLTGVFATRSPVRPNPIAITTVELLGRKGNVLRVKGLDALDGTPVIDIKGHFPSSAAESDLRLPGWASSKHSQST